MKKITAVCIAATLIFVLMTGCSKKAGTTAGTAQNDTQATAAAAARNARIAVFVPGIVSGSPVYEMLSSGVTEAASSYAAEHAEAQVKVTVIEAGTNQAEWSSKLTAVAASGDYDLIITSNPSLPELAAPLTDMFPDVQFIILDAYLEGNPAIATARYNQREQAFMAGYAAGTVTVSGDMPFANPEKKVALVAAQEYPVMNNVILPSFIEGVKAATPDATVEFRVVGNWYDASKGAELARSLYDEGVDVILPICGGAAQGVIAAAEELGFYITWFDDNGFSKAPGYIISSTVMEQARMAQEVTVDYLEGRTGFGTARTVGISEGYVRFVQDDPLYISTVAESCRAKIDAKYAEIIAGTLKLPVQSE